ncbi:hypothetical protein Hamer_G003201 [Homarus americanus]|uniref:Uncharacterized protein n=1 Tax=Homarus americanus TaxID=6706 RepID=A0A8J5N6U3_HOMAM|nr:hypothetical protein Hamer_G003201 [Homarus americanus]
MKFGTSKSRKYIPAQLGNNMLTTLPAFNALTGSDSTSLFASHTKKYCWNVFKEHQNLLKLLGKGDLCEKAVRDTEEFICRVSKCNAANSVDRARFILFGRAHPLETLPPTCDTLSFHIKRKHYQPSSWQQAGMQFPCCPLLRQGDGD